MGLVLGLAATLTWVAAVILMVLGHFGVGDPTAFYTYAALVFALAVTLTVANVWANPLALLVIFGLATFFFVSVDAFNLLGLRGIV
jgi:uncharacterized membrane protein (UPF0182 family)